MQTDNQSNLLRLGLGIVVGLILGLTVGWWLWPVQWENSDPQYLNKQAKYEYVQAIAEAYFSTHDLTTANARLTQLAGADGNVPNLLQSALDDLGNEGGVKRSSLLFLAAAIGPGQTVATGESAPIAAPEAATSTPIPSPTPTPAPARSETVSEDQGSLILNSSLMGKLFLGLLAMAMFAGGIFVAKRWVWPPLSGRNILGTSPLSSPHTSTNPARIPADAVRHPFPSAGRVSTPVPSAGNPVEPTTPTVKAIVSELAADQPSLMDRGDKLFLPPGPVLDFEEEPPLDRLPNDGYDDGKMADIVADTEWKSQILPDQTDQPRRDEPKRSDSVIRGFAGLTKLGRWVSNAFVGESRHGGSTKIQEAAPAPPVRFSPDQEGSFVAEFFVGHDFEIAKSINRGERDYVGEGGMAVSKLSTGSNAETVTALEVWLFEKNQITTRTQHLLSPHLFQSDKWDRAKLEADDPQPLEARKGLTFRLEGEEAVLNCRITDVEFLESEAAQSIFRRLRLEMVSKVK